MTNPLVCCPALWVAQVILHPWLVLSTVRFPQLRSPFLVVVGPPVKAFPPAAKCSFLFSPLSAQIFHVSPEFFLALCASLSMSEFFDLKFIFAPNPRALAGIRGPTTASLGHEPLPSLTMCVVKGRVTKMRKTLDPPSVGCSLEALLAGRNTL